MLQHKNIKFNAALSCHPSSSLVPAVINAGTKKLCLNVNICCFGSYAGILLGRPVSWNPEFFKLLPYSCCSENQMAHNRSSGGVPI